MSAERERIEREALEALGESRRMSMLRTGSPHDPIVALVLRERAAAFEEAAAMCEELLDDERKALNAGGYIEACMEARRRFTEKANGERA